MGFDGFWWVLMDFGGFWWVLMGFDGFLMGFDGFWWVLMGFDGFWWVLMGFDGFWWVLMDFDGLCCFSVTKHTFKSHGQYFTGIVIRVINLLQSCPVHIWAREQQDSSFFADRRMVDYLFSFFRRCTAKGTGLHLKVSAPSEVFFV